MAAWQAQNDLRVLQLITYVAQVLKSALLCLSHVLNPHNV